MLPYTFALFLLCTSANAGSKGEVAFQLSVGSPEISITNPDNSMAYYDGLALDAKGLFPIFFGENSSLDLTFNYKYLDTENTTTKSVGETLSVNGVGTGVNMNFYSFILGGSVEYLSAKHNASSNVQNSNLSYKFINLTYYVGMVKSFGKFDVGGFYSVSTATISKDDTGLSRDSDFEARTIWMTVRFDLGVKSKDFLKLIYD